MNISPETKSHEGKLKPKYTRAPKEKIEKDRTQIPKLKEVQDNRRAEKPRTHDNRKFQKGQPDETRTGYQSGRSQNT